MVVDLLITVSYFSSGVQFIKLDCGIRVEMEKSVTAVLVYFTTWSQSHEISSMAFTFLVNPALITIHKSKDRSHFSS